MTEYLQYSTYKKVSYLKEVHELVSKIHTAEALYNHKHINV